SQPRSILKSNRILPAKSDNKKKVEEHTRTFKSSAKTTNRVDSSISSKRTVINSNSQSVCQTCNKCLFSANHDLCVVTHLHNLNALSSVKNVIQVWRPKQAKPVGKPKQAKPAGKPKRVKQVWKPKPVKQVWKPTGKIFTTVGCKWVPTGKTFTLGDQFGNDHFGAIMGYGDYVIGDSVISRVYYVEGLGHNLFSVGQFGVELLKGSRRSNLYSISVEDIMKSSPTTVPRTPQQNGVVERRNRTLVEAARTMIIYSKAPMFLWAEAVATACFTQNRSLIHTRHNKTPYELVHNKKPDLTFVRVFGTLCYPTNDSQNLGKLQPKADIGIFVGYAPNKKGYRIYIKRTQRIMESIHVQFDELTEHMAPVRPSPGPAPNLLTPGPISSGLVPNPAHAVPYVPPTNKELELLFQPMFDEYFNPPGDCHSLPTCEVQDPVIPTGPSESITMDVDA
nr:retrovirus-related Pol polyprotein from transposon TNT 1-94 [Tanacetum cinerariifolium]